MGILLLGFSACGMCFLVGLVMGREARKERA